MSPSPWRSNCAAAPVPRAARPTYNCSISAFFTVTKPMTSSWSTTTVVEEICAGVRWRNVAGVRCPSSASGTWPTCPSRHPSCHSSAIASRSAAFAGRSVVGLVEVLILYRHRR
ncbi:hypothetical protein Ae505Ps2_2389 [Pseudonocardia sp. Ae505_Ps2]|nr:hypothetical protein Ae505Ps2_2389 [Pseudonocardia sp. Ae505_Ps2]